LPGIGGERFDVAALAFGVYGVKRERGFSGAAYAGDHGYGVVRDIHGDVLEVVDPRANYAENLLIGGGRDGFSGGQRASSDSALFARCLNL
jgi:hypothetical protein